MQIYFACPGITPYNLTRQPWHYFYSLARACARLGHKATIISDVGFDMSGTEKIDTDIEWKTIENFRHPVFGISKECLEVLNSEASELVFWSVGIGDFFTPGLLSKIKKPSVAVFTSARYAKKDLWSTFSLAGKEMQTVRSLLLTYFLSNSRIKSKGKKWKNVICCLFQSDFARTSFAALSHEEQQTVTPPLPDRFLRSLATVNFERTLRELPYKKVSYFGPPLTLRGADLIVEIADQNRDINHEVKYELLLRSDTELHRENEAKIKARIKELGLQKSFEIVSGIMPQEQLWSRLLTSDVIVLPFRLAVSDAPIVTLEALALGVHVVLTAPAGAPNIVTDYMSCSNISPESLAEAVKNHLENPVPAERRQDSSRQFIKKLSFEGFKSEINSLLSRLK